MKIIKIFITAVFIIGILFFGGALLLPSQYYYATTTSMKADPVAIYEKINNKFALNDLVPKMIDETGDSIIITSSEKYKNVHYKYLSSDKLKSYKSGFNIDAKDMETEVTWFFIIDSLEFPLNKWKGFFEARVLEEKIEDSIHNLEEFINN